ncbi:MAG: TolC family protein [Bryobacteraceae bacterium]
MPWILARRRTKPAEILLAVAALLRAQPGQPLTLEECQRRALRAASAASQARREMQITAAGTAVARAAFLPQGTASASLMYNSPSRTDPAVQSYVAWNGIREYTALAGLFQELDTSGRLRANLERARQQQAAASAALAATERDLKRAVAASYYRLLLARKLAAALESSLAEAESFERRIRQMAGEGEAARADVVKAAAQTASLRQALEAARLSMSLASQELASYWTEEVTAPLEVEDVFEQPDLSVPEEDGAAGRPWMRRPEIRLFDAQERSYLAESKLARAALLPQLRWGLDFGLDANRVAWRERGWAATASLSFPLFDWFQARNAARQARWRAAQTEEARQAALRRFSQAYQSALATLRSLRGQLDLLRTAIDLAAEDLRLSRIRFEGGEGSALDVVTAQRQLADLRMNYYSTLAAFFNAKRDLEVASGQ